MDNLIYARALKLHFLIVGVAQMRERIDVMTTLRRLQRQLSPRTRESPGALSGWLLIFLNAIMDYKGRRAMQDK